MAYKYISDSTLVRVYPTALRGGTDSGSGSTSPYDPASRLGTEFNVTNPVNRLTIDGSFVIDEAITTSKTLEISVMGYYFKILNTDTLINMFSDSDKIYAIVKLKTTTNNNYTLRTLVALNDSSTNLDVEGTGFVGLGFDSTEPSNLDGIYSLLILQKVDSNWTVPATSLLKFDPKDILIDDEKSTSSKSLHDIIYRANNSTIINADQIRAASFTGNLTGNVTGNVTGNATTATDASNSLRIGTALAPTSVGSATKPVYLSNGEFQELGSTIGSYNQPVYVKNGEIVVASKITFSTEQPSGTANVGDQWMQYIG